MLQYFKNTYTTPLGEIAYFYELTSNNSLVRAFRQDNTGIAQIQIDNTYQNQFQRCRQDLNLQPITREEFTKIMFNL